MRHARRGAARGRHTPFGPRLHAVATYLKTYQALSYERLQAALVDLFGLAAARVKLRSSATASNAAGSPRSSRRIHEPPIQVHADLTG